MITPNMHYADLKESYLFYNIAQKTKAYLEEHPEAHLYRMGIGDVSLPLCDAVIKKLHEAVDDQADKVRFHGYMPECGDPSLREILSKHYEKRGVHLSPDEVFVSSGASDELGDILDLFDRSSSALVIEPAYPAYVDANVIAGRKIVHLPSGKENGFLPEPDENTKADILYICSPNNPTGAVFDRKKLQRWIDFANENGSVILFDAAYEAFIEDETLPHSIFELEGARTCAIEICSLSKTAGFTGTRLGYTVIPSDLVRAGMNFNEMWVRNRTTKTNGVSYILQKGAEAVFTEQRRKASSRSWRISGSIKKTRRSSWRRWISWASGTAAARMRHTSGWSARTVWAAGSCSTICCMRSRSSVRRAKVSEPAGKAISASPPSETGRIPSRQHGG